MSEPINTEITILTCDKHTIVLLKCSQCEKSVCTECVFDNKDELLHLKDHYDSIIGLQVENSEYIKELHDFEGFEELNKLYKEKLIEIDSLVETSFVRIHSSKNEIIKTVKETLYGLYLYYTELFEDSVKKVNSNIKNLDISDQSAKEEFKKLKKRLDDHQEFLDNEEKIKAEFNKVVDKAIKKFERMRIPELAKEDFKFNLGKFGESYDLVGGEGSIIKTTLGKSGTYWGVTSEETLEGEFTAKVKVNKINESRISSHWNYGFGLIRANESINDTYYNNAIIFQANGYLANKFTSTGSFKKILEKWKQGDELIVKRDSKNAVWFGMNDEEQLVKAFDGITGNFRICIAFSTANKDDELELLEITK